MLPWLISLVIIFLAGFATSAIIDEVKAAATTSVIEQAVGLFFGSSRRSRGWLDSALDLFGGYSGIKRDAKREAMQQIAVVWTVAAVLITATFYFL